MEPSEQGLLEDLLAPRRENWTTFPSGEISGFFPGGWNYESFDEIDTAELTSYSNPSFLELITSSVVQPTFHCPYNGNYPFDDFSAPLIDSSYDKFQECPSMAEDGDQVGELGNKIEPEQVTTSDDIPSVFSMGLSGVRKSKSKKVEGQPSKNLMAERRRRKRLNERLSMLRSIVPKISKMDRTSILGDTIDYMKELLEKIHILKERDIGTGMDQLNMGGSFKELNMNEVQVRNPPKFDVERQNTDTRIEVCCSSKPGLLLNTVSTLEALGLDIQQCIISCFNDFSLEASCSEAAEHRTMISSEDIKQVLFRNAGYGGRCL